MPPFLNRANLAAVAVLAVAVSTVSPCAAQRTGTTRKQMLAAYQSHVLPAVDQDGIDLPYRLLSPSQIEPGKKYPLVLFLHGVGERGDDNQAQLKHGAFDFFRRRDQYPAYVIFAQCPRSEYWVSGDWKTESGKDSFPEAAPPAMVQALALVDSLSESLPVDPDRRYVCGLSMGGLGTWYAAADPQKRFAAAVAVCGGGDPTWVKRYQGVAIWVLHGSDDNVVPVQRSREMVSALSLAEQEPAVRYTEYPQMGHNIWTKTFARDDLYEWLFAQSR